MKKTGRSKQLLALILAGALTVGAVGTPVFGADFGDTAIEVSAEEEAVAEEITEEADNTAAEDEALDGSKSEEADDAEAEESDAGEVSDDAAVPEDNEDSNIEAYTVTLDANGGYFVDEWDDIKNCYADNVEILSKNIPIGGAVTSFPVREQDGSTITFLGWSFERDGESITQENEEYIPVENCVLYAVWENRGNEKEISAVTEDSEGLYTDKEEGDFKEEDNNGFNTIEETDSTTVESEEQQDDTSQRTDMTADQPENQLADQPETNQAEEFLTDTSSEEVESIPSGEAEDLDSFSHDTEEALNDTGSDNGNDAAQNQDHPIVEVDEQEETTSEDAAESVAANGALGDNLTWTLDGEGVLTISGNGEMCSVFEALWDREKVKKVIIEAGVTSIGYGAFEYHSSLSSVVIPDSVTSIGGDAFISCTSLKSVIIPESVISLGYSAFAYCSNLASVTMPEDLLRFSADAFEGTLWLDGLAATDGFTIVNGVLIRYIGDSSEVTIPHGVTIIGDSAFLRNENLTEVVIPSTVTEIGVGAFSECSNLAGITIPDEVTSIDAGAFTSCTSLANVTLPENLQVIETATFRNCTSLTNLTIPNSVTEIKSQAFSNCKLLDVALPENLIEIGKDAFFQSGLTTVTIPDKVKIIGSGAFMNCQALTSVTIPDGVTEIGGAAGGGAFYYCINLTDVTMPDGLYRCAASAFMSTPWLSTLLEKTKDAKGFSIIHGILIGYSGAANEITIPDGVTIIGSEALSCRCLTSVTLPGSVNEIDSLAFSNNYNLTNIRIPVSVTKIGDMAFEGCTFDGYDDSYSDFTIYGYAGSEAERYANKAGHTFIAIEQSLLTNATVTVEDKTYTGEEIKPVPDVKLNGKTLTADVDYTVSYSNNTNAGTATVKITGIGQYQGTVTKTFTIKKADPVLAFANTSVSKKTTDSSFTNTLTKTTDGTITFSSSNTSVATVNSSSGQVTIKGTGNAIITANAAEGNNYKAGSASYSLTVSARTLSDCTMTVSPTSYTYDGTEKKPTVTIKYNSANLTINTDYTVSYSNNTNAGTGTVTATGKGSYSGTLSKTFTIEKASPALSFASSSVTKKTTDTAFTNTLTKTTDGTVTFSSSNTSVATVNSSSGQVTIKGTGNTTITANAAEGNNYKAGSASYSLTVSALSLSDCTMTVSPTSYTYDGAEKKPTVTIKYNSTNLTINTDYTVSYSNNTNAGTGTVTATGKGGYSGTLSKTFTIGKATPVLIFENDSVFRTTASEPFITPFTTKKTDGTITYSSSDTNIAVVDSTGKVTVKNTGSVTITANASEGRNYWSGSSSYLLTINKTLGLSDLSYSFINTYSSFGYPKDGSYKIPVERYEIFWRTIRAHEVFSEASAWEGSCFGMASTSGMFNTSGSGLIIPEFNSNAAKLDELQPSDRNSNLGLSVQELIEAMQISQSLQKIQKERNNNRNNISAICEEVKKVEESGAFPVSICIYGISNGKKSGHALLGYKFEKIDASHDRICVYDCNYPHEERYIELTKSNGIYTGWKYEISKSSHMFWGTLYNDYHPITFVPYSVYQSAWADRDLKEEGNLLHVNAASFDILDYTGERIAVMRDGVLTSSDSNIFQFLSLDSTTDVNTVYLPTDVYKIINKDDNVQNFELSMTNNDQLASVTTDASTVQMTVSDNENLNLITVYANEGESYNVVLNSDLPSAEGREEVQFNGIGDGSTLQVGMDDGICVLNNCTGINMWINGNLVGSTSESYQHSIEGYDASLAYTECIYDGTNKEPALTLRNGNTTLENGRDYVVIYENNIYPGTAKANAYGIGSYTGKLTLNFEIKAYSLTKATVSGIQSKTYNSKAQTQTPVVKAGSTILNIGTDYTISYKNNVNAGTASMTITGKGNYSGAVTKEFKINKAAQSITAANLSLTFPNSGKITASGNKGSLSYKSSNTAIATVDSTGKVTAKGAGKATITITAVATSNYNAATKTITVTVAKAAQSITAKAAASFVAVGKTTTVSITGAKGTKSYKSSDTTIATVTSAGKVTAKKVGTVKITATSAATAQYNAASKTVTIKVVPAATASLTAANQATGIKLTWKKVTGANGYKVYRGSTLIKTITSVNTVTFADTKANTNGTKYTYKVVAKASTGDSTLSKSVAVYRVARPAVSSVTNSASKKMTVKWDKNAKATGYQIQYSTDKTFKSGNKAVTVTGASTVSKVIGSLTKGKTYYVRIRTYKTIGSAKYWSVWSAARSVKISK